MRHKAFNVCLGCATEWSN